MTFTITAHEALMALGVCGLLGIGGVVGFVWASLRVSGGFW